MRKYLLDTDILIDYFKLKAEATDLIGSLLNKHPMAISVLSIAELRAGWTPQVAAKHLPRLSDLFVIEPVIARIAAQAGTWQQEYKPKGVTLHTVDTLIAATAYLHNCCLITKNRKDYPMPEVQLYPWDANA